MMASDSLYRLEQMGMVAVNTVVDVFIYYVATVYSEDRPEGLMAFLWLTMLKEVLKFSEQGHK
jgi:hypothetical protein